MRVAVTRPEISGQKTAALLRARGHDPIILPLSTPVHDTGAIASALSKSPDIIAVTSAEAIRALCASERDMDLLRHTTMFTVGEASASAARSAGFAHVIAGDGDGRKLAQMIFETQAENAKGSVLYLAGSPREAGFEAHLSTLNIPFDTIEIYRMHPKEWSRAELESILFSHPLDAVLFYSSEAVRKFFDLIKHYEIDVYPDHGKFICISTKVLSVVPKALQNRAFAASAPREAEMFELLERLKGT